MSGLRVPKRAAEKPNSRRTFPEGQWLVELQDAKSREPQPFMLELRDGAKRPRIGSGGELLGLQFGDAQPLLDGQEDAGNQKLFLDLVVQDGDIAIDSVNFDAAEGLGWGILRDAAMFTNLALALGSAIEENGFVSPSDDFLDNLRNGVFKGHKVIVEVKHNAWRSKDGSKSGVNVDIQAFQPAA